MTSLFNRAIRLSAAAAAVSCGVLRFGRFFNGTLFQSSRLTSDERATANELCFIRSLRTQSRLLMMGEVGALDAESPVLPTLFYHLYLIDKARASRGLKRFAAVPSQYVASAIALETILTASIENIIGTFSARHFGSMLSMSTATSILPRATLRQLQDSPFFQRQYSTFIARGRFSTEVLLRYHPEFVLLFVLADSLDETAEEELPAACTLLRQFWAISKLWFSADELSQLRSVTATNFKVLLAAYKEATEFPDQLLSNDITEALLHSTILRASGHETAEMWRIPPQFLRACLALICSAYTSMLKEASSVVLNNNGRPDDLRLDASKFAVRRLHPWSYAASIATPVLIATLCSSEDSLIQTMLVPSSPLNAGADARTWRRSCHDVSRRFVWEKQLYAPLGGDACRIIPSSLYCNFTAQLAARMFPLGNKFMVDLLTAYPDIFKSSIECFENCFINNRVRDYPVRAFLTDFLEAVQRFNPTRYEYASERLAKINGDGCALIDTIPLLLENVPSSPWAGSDVRLIEATLLKFVSPSSSRIMGKVDKLISEYRPRLQDLHASALECGLLDIFSVYLYVLYIAQVESQAQLIELCNEALAEPEDDGNAAETASAALPQESSSSPPPRPLTAPVVADLD